MEIDGPGKFERLYIELINPGSKQSIFPDRADKMAVTHPSIGALNVKCLGKITAITPDKHPTAYNHGGFIGQVDEKALIKPFKYCLFILITK